MDKLDVTNGWGEPPHVPPRCWPSLQHSLISHHCQRGNSPPCSATKPRQLFFCLRPPSPQINNPQNLILGGRVEALESHYFHIPYPGALGLLRECGRPGAGKAQACSGNLRPCARLQGEMSPDCITLGSVWQNRGFMPWGGEGDIANMLVTLSHHASACSIAESVYCCYIKKAICLHSRREVRYKLITVRCKVTHKI